MAGWDSLAAITLVNVIEEEFGVALDLADLPSFGKILNFLDSSRIPGNEP